MMVERWDDDQRTIRYEIPDRAAAAAAARAWREEARKAEARGDPVPPIDQPPTAPEKRQRITIGGILVALVAIGWIAMRLGFGGDSVSTTDAPSVERRDIAGRFVGWEAIDDAGGTARFTVTNRGSAAATVTCTVWVYNDDGNFGFGLMDGESLAPDQTRNFSIPIGVGKGAYVINRGEVKDC